ncbi:MAG: NAD(P)-dependent oxidoreductase, partial [Planctomycetes bacterium]|nr:NAD(P)-dependent oxidoreductase [Planctomycetota bacterium]
SSKLLDAIAGGERVYIANPEEIGDWLYVKDAVKALVLLLEKGDTRQYFYNILGESHSIRAAMTTAKRLFPEADIVFNEKAAVSDNPYPAEYDDSAARNELGWRPDYTLESGFREHVALLRGKS